MNRADGADSNNNAADFSLSAAITPAGGPATGNGGPGRSGAGPPAAKTIAEIQGTGTAARWPATPSAPAAR